MTKALLYQDRDKPEDWTKRNLINDNLKIYKILHLTKCLVRHQYKHLILTVDNLVAEVLLCVGGWTR